jgi:hypothetical protein
VARPGRSSRARPRRRRERPSRQETARADNPGHARREQQTVHVGRRNDEAVTHREAVREYQRLAGRQPAPDLILEHRRLGLVRQQHLYCVPHRIGNLERLEPVGGGALAVLVRAVADDNGHAAVAKTQRLRATLDAVAKDGNRLSGKCCRIDVPLVENLAHSCW